MRPAEPRADTLDPLNVGDELSDGIDAAVVRVTQRDLEVLPVIAEQCAVTLPQLARLIVRTERTARWLRDRWQRAGWVESRVLLVGRPVFIWLTSRGHTACGVEFKTWRPHAVGRLAHLAAVTDVRIHVAVRRPQAEWVSERVIARRDFEAGERRKHLPDAEVLIGDQRVAVEVELTQKERRRTQAIVAELSARYDAVWYFVAPGVRRHLAEVIARNKFTRVQILDLPRPSSAPDD
jgi:hypothetical protein